MRFITAICLALILMAGSCKESASTEASGVTNSEEAPETLATAYKIHDANPAWASEELNERISPARSVILPKSKNDFQIAIHYSAPGVKGRTIWDSLVMLDKVWRTGANEATIIEFSHDVHIQKSHLKAGSYSLFTIPKANGWTVILNSVSDQWGAYDYSDEEDVARFDVENEEVEMTEELNFDITRDSDTRASINFKWDTRGFKLPIEQAKDSQ